MCGDIVLDVPLSITIRYLLCCGVVSSGLGRLVDAIMFVGWDSFVSWEKVIFRCRVSNGLAGSNDGKVGCIGDEEDMYD